MASGAPDWQKVFTLVPPSMTHGAPDWERTAVGPGGEPIAGITTYGQLTAVDQAFVPGGSITLGTLVCTNPAAGLAMLAFTVPLGYSTTVAADEGWTMEAGGDLVPYSGWLLPIAAAGPGAIVNGAAAVAQWCGLVNLTQAAAVIALALRASANCTGATAPGGNPVMGVWAP